MLRYRVNHNPLYHHSRSCTQQPHSLPFHQTQRFSAFYRNRPLLMQNASDYAGASPPDTRPDRMPERDGVVGPTIKISVSYGSSLHEIHLPPQSTFGKVSSSWIIPEFDCFEDWFQLYYFIVILLLYYWNWMWWVRFRALVCVICDVSCFVVLCLKKIRNCWNWCCFRVVKWNICFHFSLVEN